MDQNDQPQEIELKFETMRGGASLELVNNALQRAVDNINDINTTLDTREVVVKIALKPSDDRAMIAIGTKVTAKLAGQEPEICSAAIKIGRNGRAFAQEIVKQLPFPGIDGPIPMRRAVIAEPTHTERG